MVEVLTAPSNARGGTFECHAKQTRKLLPFEGMFCSEITFETNPIRVVQFEFNSIKNVHNLQVNDGAMRKGINREVQNSKVGIKKGDFLNDRQPKTREGRGSVEER